MGRVKLGVLRLALETLAGALWPHRVAAGRARRRSLRGVAVTALIDTAGWYLTKGRRVIALTSRGPGGPETAERIRQSLELTVGAGTARTRFFSQISGGLSWPAVGPDGQIDFRQQRYLCGDDDDRELIAPGVTLFGGRGEWEAAHNDPDLLEENDPFWLLALIAATVDATDEGPQSIRGTQCERYLATADFQLAASNAKRTLVPPPESDSEGLVHLPLEIWIDGQRRIRGARLHRKRSWTSLELFDFGIPGPIELPSEDEITYESDS